MRTNRIVALMVVVGILCVFIAMFLTHQTPARWDAKDVKHCVETGYEAGWKAGAKNLAAQLVDHGLLYWQDPNFQLSEYFEEVDKKGDFGQAVVEESLHEKRYKDGFTELWCGDTRIHFLGGPGNFTVPECHVCGMYVYTTGISPETDRIYETEAYGNGPCDKGEFACRNLQD